MIKISKQADEFKSMHPDFFELEYCDCLRKLANLTWSKISTNLERELFSNSERSLDNAVAESFFSCMTREKLFHNYYDTIEELQRDIGEYVDFLQYATTSAIRNVNSE